MELLCISDSSAKEVVGTKMHYIRAEISHLGMAACCNHLSLCCLDLQQAFAQSTASVMFRNQNAVGGLSGFKESKCIRESSVTT